MAHSRSAVSVSGAVGVRLSQQQMAGVPPTDVEDHFVGHNSSQHKMIKAWKNETQNTQEKGVAKIIKNGDDGFLSENAHS